MDPILHVGEIATRAQVELERSFLQAIFHSQVDRTPIFGQKVRVTARIPIEVVQRRIAIVMAVAQGETHGFVERQLIGEGGRRKQAHGLTVGPVVARREVEAGTVERLATKRSIGRHHVTAFQSLIVVAPHLLVVPLQFGLQGPALVEVLLQVSYLVQDQGVILGVDKSDRIIGDGIAGQEEITLVLHKGRRLQLQAARLPKGLERDEVAREVVPRPLLGVDVEHIGHDGRQVAVVPLIPR